MSDDARKAAVMADVATIQAAIAAELAHQETHIGGARVEYFYEREGSAYADLDGTLNLTALAEAIARKLGALAGEQEAG